MTCPKCKAKVGIMMDTVVVGTGPIRCIRCYICGYFFRPESP